MKRLFLSLISITLFCFCSITLAAPQKNLWPRWQVNDPVSKEVLSFYAWKVFLKKNIHTNADGINLIDYGSVTPFDKKLLANFLEHMSSVQVDRYNRNQQEAYWFNVYNALIISTVLKHYPVKSILDISISGWLKPGPWDAKLIRVEGIWLSLNDIEHRILRPIWNDQRIHFVLNSASMSAPNLQKIPFAGIKVNTMLNKATTEYINSKRGSEIKNGRLTVSSIYGWYKQDFGGTGKDIINFLKLYAKPQLKEALTHVRNISNYHYNWALNKWTRKKKRVRERGRISKLT